MPQSLKRCIAVVQQPQSWGWHRRGKLHLPLRRHSAASLCLVLVVREAGWDGRGRCIGPQAHETEAKGSLLPGKGGQIRASATILIVETAAKGTCLRRSAMQEVVQRQMRHTLAPDAECMERMGVLTWDGRRPLLPATVVLRAPGRCPVSLASRPGFLYCPCAESVAYRNPLTAGQL